MEFAEDPRYQQIAEAYAQDAVAFARNTLRRQLDWTDSSIETLESILDRFHRDLPSAKPNDAQVLEFSKMWGSYLGEVYRKNHGAVWGVVRGKDELFPGLKTKSGIGFWPWGRVENRLREGAQHNVWQYYLQLMGNSKPSARP